MCTAFLLALAVLAGARGATAQPPSVVLIDPDPALARAVTSALEPWGAEVREAAEPSPGASMPSSAARGRGLAVEHDALAVVWVSSSADGFALWIYDRRDDRVVARALPSGPPFDEPMAAEVALMVKTLLRHSPVARPEMPAPTPPPPVLVWVGARGGARLWSTSTGDLEARFGLSLSVWPVELEEHLGVGLRLASGPGVSIDAASFVGHWTDTQASASIAARAAFDRLELGAAAFFGAHLTTLQGRLAGAQPIIELRVDPITGAELQVDLRLDRRVRLGLAAAVTVPLTTQRYLAGTEVVFAVERASGSLALVLGLGLP